MYVCVCNVLTDRDVAAATRAGMRTVLDVYRYHGCLPNCGKCMPTIQAMLPRATATTAVDTYVPDSIAAE